MMMLDYDKQGIFSSADLVLHWIVMKGAVFISKMNVFVIKTF